MCGTVPWDQAAHLRRPTSSCSSWPRQVWWKAWPHSVRHKGHSGCSVKASVQSAQQPPCSAAWSAAESCCGGGGDRPLAERRTCVHTRTHMEYGAPPHLRQKTTIFTGCCANRPAPMRAVPGTTRVAHHAAGAGAVSGKARVACGVWRVACGVSREACGVWRTMRRAPVARFCCTA